MFYFDVNVHLPLALVLPKHIPSLSSEGGEGDGRGLGHDLASDEVGSPLGWRY